MFPFALFGRTWKKKRCHITILTLLSFPQLISSTISQLIPSNPLPFLSCGKTLFSSSLFLYFFLSFPLFLSLPLTFSIPHPSHRVVFSPPFFFSLYFSHFLSFSPSSHLFYTVGHVGHRYQSSTLAGRVMVPASYRLNGQGCNNGKREWKEWRRKEKKGEEERKENVFYFFLSIIL